MLLPEVSGNMTSMRNPPRQSRPHRKSPEAPLAAKGAAEGAAAEAAAAGVAMSTVAAETAAGPVAVVTSTAAPAAIVEAAAAVLWVQSRCVRATCLSARMHRFRGSIVLRKQGMV